VLFATGRSATTNLLNLSKIGLKTNPTNNKIITKKDEVEQTNIDNIYALGDVVEGLPELTSTATKMGWSLGRRIAHRQHKKSFK
jgi:pyruvate/2-oxoglutarate dehydrogenase complex dihydrolipoamide dehydrogenase (E3) component